MNRSFWDGVLYTAAIVFAGAAAGMAIAFRAGFATGPGTKEAISYLITGALVISWVLLFLAYWNLEGWRKDAEKRDSARPRAA